MKIIADLASPSMEKMISPFQCVALLANDYWVEVEMQEPCRPEKVLKGGKNEGREERR